ncbi:M20/M25/M40 family metallo-hydrolase [Adhaeribacter rhizoryzae]|uniref:Carboxypeptidase Q n=1 Tax=Adhaeribacter rhizoryzae TaxID=2607907 RepID=A0A5M6DM07_9BACT|nr:M20/M25/M40 family metallo-hydrolase [Adhaeribacter rhizoryzae]KAA5547446.1 M20/M25/M40 family metallo-hydrolase [Adhaeribacter rhizoryzae]
MFYKFHKLILAAAFSFSLFSSQAQGQQPDSAVIRNIYREALTQGKSYENLRYLCTQIGPRLSGSEGAAKAVTYTQKLMESYGFDRVYLQDVMVPHWVRGEKEKAFFKSSVGKQEVPICALGGSVGTGKKGIKAQVVEVQSFEELQQLGREKVQGKVVFFNRPMNPAYIEAFLAYRDAVNQRSSGAIEAAKLGAVGAIVRSMNLALDDFPHTGSTRYEEGVTKIPAAAISTNGAELLSRQLKAGPNLEFNFKMNPQTLPDAPSHNVIGEIKGSEHPEEIIVVGGHLDSWDLAQGAHDDGTGCMQAIEVLRLLKVLNIKPKRTIRAVMYMNEENGLRGGRKYAEVALANKENHIAALESDAGGFTPRGFSIDASPNKVADIAKWKELLVPYGLNNIAAGGGGADIGPLKNDKIALIGFRPDSQRYFEVHHAASDTFDRVNQRELELGGASMAALIYLIDKYGL